MKFDHNTCAFKFKSNATTQPTADTKLQSKHAASINTAGILLRIVFIIAVMMEPSDIKFLLSVLMLGKAGGVYFDVNYCKPGGIEAGKLIAHVNSMWSHADS